MSELTDWIHKSLRRSITETKKRAKRRGIQFEITKEYIDHLTFINPERCSLSGIQFKLRAKNFTRNPYAPSIDRIDNTRGYTPENIRIVAYCINNAMNEWGEGILKEITTAYKNWNPQ